MDPKDNEPFARTPWRRLLGAGPGEPSREMDRRILAESRRALTPRVNRWWLPASLAASVLLAVLLVQRQFAIVPAPVSESDVVMPPTPGVAAPSTDLAAAESRSAPAAVSPAPAPAMAPSSARQEPALEREQAAFAKSAVDVPAAMPRPPEEWYAEIRKLRAAGRVSEADKELARFKAAYPGWLEQQDRKDP